MNRTVLTVIGFTLFLLGSMSLILNFVGVRFSFLVWLDAMGRLPGFITRILMIVIGVVLIILSRSEEDEYEEEIDY